MNTKFKIGDKVKVCEPNFWRQGDKIGEVTNVDSPYIRVSWENNEDMLYIPSEIYKVYTKGQQLMFFFMKG